VLPEGFSALNVSKNDGFQDQKKVLAGIPARTIYQNSILRSDLDQSPELQPDWRIGKCGKTISIIMATMTGTKTLSLA